MADAKFRWSDRLESVAACNRRKECARSAVGLAMIGFVQSLMCAGVIAVLALPILAVAVGRRDRRAGAGLALLVVVGAAGAWTSLDLLTGVKREMAFDMEWSYAEKSPQYPDADHIVLRFKDYPNHSNHFFSRNLGNYLETLPSHDVRVVYEVTLDFGKTRGFKEVRIGQLELGAWDVQNGYYQTIGDETASPWP